MTKAIDVLFPLPMAPLTYLAPLAAEVPPVGWRVVVPWQTGVRVGVVAAHREVGASRGMELRHAVAALGPGPWLNPWVPAALAELGKAVGAPAGTVLITFGPPGLSPELRHEVRLTAAGLAALGSAEGGAPPGLEAERWVDAALLPAPALELLRRQGLMEERAPERVRTRTVLLPLRPPDDELEGPRRINQRLALEMLLELESADSAAALARDAEVPESAVRSLILKGYAGYGEVARGEVAAPMTAPLAQPPAAAEASVDTTLSEGETVLVGGLRRDRLAALLPIITADVRGGSSVIVLAPEVAIANEAASFLGESLPVQLLSGDHQEEARVRAWSELPVSGPVVVVGTYPALLAPVARLARVVVLEAGNSAYKLRSGARLALPKAAVRLAAAAGAELLLSDVFLTPELATFAPPQARRSLPLPALRLHVADLSGSPNWPLHPDLLLTLRQVEQRHRQAVVIAPRRGFSGALGCRDCGWQAPCPNCDLSLRLHQQELRLRCHQCGHEEPPPDRCPNCGGSDLAPLRGAGTQWVLAQLKSLLPGFPLHRFDRDHRADMAPLLSGEPGVVIGTTAALRLPPLPKLSLVALTHFDAHLAMADFRAEEEALRTLLQTAELAGGQRPLLLVQTHSPGNELLTALAEEAAADKTKVEGGGAGKTGVEGGGAVAGMLGRQLERRRAYGYPPYSTLAKLQFSARDRASALNAAELARSALLVAGAAEAEVLGPESAPVERVRARYAFQLLVRAEGDERMAALLAGLPQRFAAARLNVDVDPRDVGELLD